MSGEEGTAGRLPGVSGRGRPGHGREHPYQTHTSSRPAEAVSHVARPARGPGARGLLEQAKRETARRATEGVGEAGPGHPAPLLLSEGWALDSR